MEGRAGRSMLCRSCVYASNRAAGSACGICRRGVLVEVVYRQNTGPCVRSYQCRHMAACHHADVRLGCLCALQWAVFERRRRNLDTAEQCFLRALALAPGNPHIWYAYATMKWKAGDLAGARAIFQQASTMCPRNAPLWMECALMEWEAGDLEAAVRLFEQGSKVPRSYQHPPLYDAWARLEAEMGHEARAQELEQRYQQVEREKTGRVAAAAAAGEANAAGAAAAAAAAAGAQAAGAQAAGAASGARTRART
jgi:tetratricopeptide (TPR) repeat protein